MSNNNLSKPLSNFEQVEMKINKPNIITRLRSKFSDEPYYIEKNKIGRRKIKIDYLPKFWRDYEMKRYPSYFYSENAVKDLGNMLTSQDNIRFAELDDILKSELGAKYLSKIVSEMKWDEINKIAIREKKILSYALQLNDFLNSDTGKLVKEAIEKRYKDLNIETLKKKLNARINSNIQKYRQGPDYWLELLKPMNNASSKHPHVLPSNEINYQKKIDKIKKGAVEQKVAADELFDKVNECLNNIQRSHNVETKQNNKNSLHVTLTDIDQKISAARSYYSLNNFSSAKEILLEVVDRYCSHRAFRGMGGGKQFNIKAEKPKKAAEKIFYKTNAKKITVINKDTGRKYNYIVKKDKNGNFTLKNEK